MIVTRPEQPEDRDDIAEVNRQAFGREGEARLIEQIRQAPGFDAALSLVATLPGKIVGHILFSPVTIESDGESVPVLALAPMAVRPECQRQGIGSALVREGLTAARRLRHDVVIVLGHPDFYPRFGFVPASGHGITAPFDVPDEAFMVLPLSPRALANLRGTVRYPPAFEGL